MKKQRIQPPWIFPVESLLVILFTILVSIGVIRYFNHCDIGTNANARLFSVIFFNTPIFFLVFVLTTVVLRLLLYRFLTLPTSLQWMLSIVSKIIISILLYAYILYHFQDYPMLFCQPLTPYWG